MIIDTNVLIYDTFKDLEKHQEAKEILDSLPEWLTPSVVIIEFIAFLNKSGLEREKILDKLEELLNNPKLVIIRTEKEDILNSLKIIKKEKLSTLKINDKIILSMAKRLGKEIITFDKKLANQLKE